LCREAKRLRKILMMSNMQIFFNLNNFGKKTIQQQDAKPKKVLQYEKSKKHKSMILQL
jgi:hypothetical protein